VQDAVDETGERCEGADKTANGNRLAGGRDTLWNTHLLKRVAPPNAKRCKTLKAPLSVSSSEGARASTASFW
jgi:hypothetical protein